MNEIAIREEQAATGTVARLADWAEEARAAYQLAATLCKTTFVPDHFRNKPEEATAAILTGHEIGFSPMAALRAIYVIKGTPGMYAVAMRAAVQSHGHEIWVDESTATRAIVCGRRKGASEVQRSVWTIERAKQAGLISNPQYQKNPQNMLIARATAELCRLIAADALHGVPYAVEELDDDAEPTTVQAQVKPARRTARRAPLETSPPPPAAEPDLEDNPPPEPAEPEGRVHGAEPEPDVEPEPTPGPEPMGPSQQRMMHALFREQGITDRAERLAYVADVIGRDVGTSKELTKDEAARVLDRLTAAERPALEPAEPEPEP